MNPSAAPVTRIRHCADVCAPHISIKSRLSVGVTVWPVIHAEPFHHSTSTVAPAVKRVCPMITQASHSTAAPSVTDSVAGSAVGVQKSFVCGPKAFAAKPSAP